MKILLAEDETDLSRAVAKMLEISGYEVDCAADGQEALELSRENAYDCFVLDIMMPRMDGVEALRQMREGGDLTPVIMLTAKAEVEDRVAGLEAGADDYLTKPFAMKELLARVRSQTRRRQEYTPDELHAGNVTLVVAKGELRSSNSIRLADRETKLMELLLRNIGKPIPTDEILSRVWRDDPEANAQVVWIYVSYLKNKLKSIAANLEICGEEGGSFHARVVDEPGQ